jgi:hypothetical protein
VRVRRCSNARLHTSQRIPDVVGIFVAGSLPAGTADAYSDIDLRIIAAPEGQARLLAERLASPSQWGDLLFNEWMDGTQHCVLHFRPFLKVDVFYLGTDTFVPSPWLKFPASVLLDRTGVAQTARALQSRQDIGERSRRRGTGEGATDRGRMSTFRWRSRLMR